VKPASKRTCPACGIVEEHRSDLLTLGEAADLLVGVLVREVRVERGELPCTACGALPAEVEGRRVTLEEIEKLVAKEDVQTSANGG
jgi:hypothetical protein